MDNVTDLLDRPTYSIQDLDGLLILPRGTARRWIDGYERAGRRHPPVVRPHSSGDETVTWGEFVEARLLAEFRRGGALMVHMHRAVERLREEMNTLYPLAHARPFLDVEGRELVLRVQKAVHLPRSYQLVVIRNDQLVLTDETAGFRDSSGYGEKSRIVERIHPQPDLRLVVFDPLRRSGLPVVAGRSVPTDVVAEQIRAGDSVETIAEGYGLTRDQVEAAVRYELLRATAMTPVASAGGP